jgi:hypothetical protein
MSRQLILTGLGAALLVLAFLLRARPPKADPSARAAELRVGQEWRFKGRPQDPDPRLIIDRLEQHPKMGTVVHISVRGVRIVNPRAPGGHVEEVGHMPFAREAVQRSVTQLVHDSVALPAFESGYDEWQRAQGGVFTISVREGLDFIEKTRN